MSERSVTFYFDYISPYAYFAWPKVRKIAAAHGSHLTAVPVLFAGLLTAQGNLGPAEIPAKRLYIFRNCQRLAQDQGLPFRCPPTHPFDPLPSLRITNLIQDPEQRSHVVTTLLDKLWGQGLAIDTPDALAGGLANTGLDLEDLLRQALEPEAKARLRRQTEEAVDIGVFGVPTVVAGKEVFWGVDSLDHLDRHLGGEVSQDDCELERWRNVQATAGRKRKDLRNLTLLRDQPPLRRP